MAQLVLGAAGAFVGSFFGMPQVGWAIGSAIGGALSQQTQKSQGPRLSDLKVTGTEYGQPIPWVQGHPIISGQMWWASDRREIATTTEVGKGGPSAEQTTYTYEVDVLIGLTDNEIAGVSRILSNGKLVWTNLSDSDDESVIASGSTEVWTRMTIYTGSDLQLPDPTYEAAVGTANAPAYRGRAYVFIEGLQLGNSGQIPNLTFEVCSAGGSAAATVVLFADLVSSGNDYNPAQPGACAYSNGGFLIHLPKWDSQYLTDAVAVFEVNSDGSATPVTTYHVDEPSVMHRFDVTQAGQTDVSGLMLAQSDSAFWFQGEGEMTSFTLPSSGSLRFCRRGHSFYFAGRTSLVDYVSKHGEGGGSATVSNLTTGAFFSAIAAGETLVWALTSDAQTIYEFNESTLAVVQTFAPPTLAGCYISTDENGELWSTTNTTAYKRVSGVWVPLITGLNNTFGAFPGDADHPSHVAGLAAYVQAEPPTGPSFHKEIYKAVPRFTPADETLSDVVARLCRRAGLEDAQFSVTALSTITKPVRALAVSQVGNTRSILDLLASAFYFEAVLSDKLYFVPRGGASAVTVPYADLGASVQETGSDEPFAVRPLNELEVPAQVAVSYMNIDTECQRDTQFSDRLISSVQSTSAVEMALGMTASEAKGVAQSMVMDGIASAMSVKVSLLPTYSRLEPTDVITAVAVDGSTFRLRLVKKLDSGVLDFDAVLDDAGVLVDAGITSDDYEPSITVQAPASTVLELLDIPILRDTDNAPGIYVAGKGSTYPWAGGVVYRSTDNIQFDQVASLTESGVLGETTTTLGDFTGGYLFDMVNTLTVDVGGGELASTTRDSMLADDTVNALLVGSEVLRFLTATLVGGGVYTLSGFLRGQRGTEWAIDGHVSSERVVLLQARGMRRLVEQSSDIGIVRHYKGITVGRRLSTSEGEAFVDTGVALKPFSPVHARGDRDSDGDMVISWMRRTRLATRFAGVAGISVPLGEALESYAVDIFTDDTFTDVIRTIFTTEEDAHYTPDMVAADFGVVQDTLYVRIYQISTDVGRGYPLESTVDFPPAIPVPVVVYTGIGAAKNVVSNIDAKTDGAVLLKGLIGIGTPNVVMINLSGTTADMNTSAVSGAVASSGNTLGTLGIAMTAASAYNTGGMQSVAVFLPKRADLFELVSWTGDGSGDRSLSHSIGVAPALALVKRRDNADSWKMYSSRAGANKSLTFPSSSGAAFGTDTASFPNASTSSLFKVGSALNVSGAQYEALVFSASSSLVDEGTYTGNGSGTGPSVSLGYQPKLLLIRSLGATNRFTFITSDELASTSYTHWMLDDQGGAPATSSLVTLSPTGFDVASADGTVNENAVSYQYIALKPWE